MEEFSEGLIFVYGPPFAVERYTLYPEMEVDVLAFQDRSTVCWIVAPVPLMLSDARTDPLLRNEILPEAVPETVGLNVTVKGTLCPAAMVMGKVMPFSVKAELLELAEEIATLPPLAMMLPC